MFSHIPKIAENKGGRQMKKILNGFTFKIASVISSSRTGVNEFKEHKS